MLHTVDRYTSIPSATVVLLLVLTVTIVAGAVLGFPSGWTTGFEIGMSALTLLMVTVIQHTQGREQAAAQRKLDELLRSTPLAQSDLIMLEEESDERIQEVEETHRRSKTGAR